MMPALRAWTRTLSSGYAVTMIVGMAFPDSTNRLYSSTPVIAGIWTSAIRQEVLRIFLDARKARADEKASTLYPSDLIKLVSASRKP
jgi:hypothetical protein